MVDVAAGAARAPACGPGPSRACAQGASLPRAWESGVAGARRAPEHTHAAPGAPPAAGPRPAGVRSSVGPQGARGPDLFTDPFVPQARLEVHRFGITGYGKGQERVLERERAVMLGAQVSAASGRAPGRHAGGAGERGQGPGASCRGTGERCPAHAAHTVEPGPRGVCAGRAGSHVSLVFISAPQEELRELQGFAGANQGAEGSAGGGEADGGCGCRGPVRAARAGARGHVLRTPQGGSACDASRVA